MDKKIEKNTGIKMPRVLSKLIDKKRKINKLISENKEDELLKKGININSLYYRGLSYTEIESDEVHTFIFFTPSGKKYIVYFQDSSDLVYPDSPPRSLFFSINFQPVGSASRGSREDFYEPEKVRDTIIRACQIFLKKFIQKEVEIGLVFICDDQDNKETQRLRLFHRWFKSCKEITTFENFHFEFHTEKYSDGSFCCGAILNKKNATFKSQLKDFQSAVTSNLSLDQG